MPTGILGDGGIPQNLNMQQIPRAADQVRSYFNYTHNHWIMLMQLSSMINIMVVLSLYTYILLIQVGEVLVSLF